ncbi:MAG: hypothetical protein ROW48_02235 [Bellilinea sp.]|jgi:hypothetical protein
MFQRIIAWINRLIPLWMLLAALGLDRVEMLLRRDLWLENGLLYWWLQGATRLAFALLVGLGLYDLFHPRRATRLRGVSWLVWGLLGMGLSLPLARTAALTELLAGLPLPFTFHLFYLASGFLLTGGLIRLLVKPGGADSSRQNQPESAK